MLLIVPKRYLFRQLHVVLTLVISRDSRIWRTNERQVVLLFIFEIQVFSLRRAVSVFAQLLVTHSTYDVKMDENWVVRIVDFIRRAISPNLAI